jgi:two-component system, NtrC family, response regulator HydG
MQARQLTLDSLLHSDPDSGLLYFAGERALLLGAEALGLLRGELIHTVGGRAARGILTRFGYAHGWRTAESMKHGFPWDTEREWRIAGGQLHQVQGLVTVEPVVHELSDASAPFAEAVWHDSYEAEQHLAQFGRSDEPVCWTLTGFASGYLSHCNGRPIYCIEDRCRARGDAVCHMKGATSEAWGDALAEHLPFYEQGCLDKRLDQLTEKLKRTELRLRKQTSRLSAPSREAFERSGIVAKSPAMKRLVATALRVARVDSTVLLTGESGSGKERVARLLHQESERLAGPFVAVNCGALTDTLLESELFGHAKGAFTGATRDREGLFEAAQGGSLFLDEIGEVSPTMQVKLLRALQERKVRRVGENEDRPVNVRLIAATNKHLSDEVKAGRFRSDLYYRLNVVELRVPALRERKEDVLPLARVLLDEIAARTGLSVRGIAPGVADELLRYAWPGNVRELANALERAAVLALGQRIEAEDLPEEIRGATFRDGSGSGRTLEDVEREHILSVLETNAGNQQKTAAELGIGTATLYRKLRRYRGGRRRA